MNRRPPSLTRTDTLFPYTTLFRSGLDASKRRRNRRRTSARQCRSGAQRARTCFLRSPAQTICRAPSRINRLRPAKRRLRTLLGLIPAFFVLGSSSCRRHLGTKRSAFSTQQRGRIQNGAFTRNRSEERRVGKECVSTCRSRRSTYHEQKISRNRTITNREN